MPSLPMQSQFFDPSLSPYEIILPEGEFDEAMPWVMRGREFMNSNAIGKAAGCFNQAMAIVHQFPHAVIESRKISELYLKEGLSAYAQGDQAKALWFAVTALETYPKNPAARELLRTIEAIRPRQDITKYCYVFYDQDRAERIHREAILRCLEYTAISGVVGDVMEFGVLAGWSARIFSETMRDIRIIGDLHLFDSFEGLPEYESSVDRESFEIAGRNIWSDKMKFPDDFIASLGGSLEEHIRESLSHVIRRERIKLHRGFYSESLLQPIPTKAALVHIDCDLYQSTVEVLEGLFRQNVFQDGCVLMFDDWNCNKASPYFGERRAFREFLENQQKFETSLFFTYGFNGAAFILHEKPAL